LPSRIKTATTINKALSGARDYRRRPDRADDNKFYCSTAWRKLRAAILRRSPLCVDCGEAGRVTAASEVHHVKERRDFPDLALDPSNLEGLCRPCHNRKRRGR
jgi:5-methylcytosine-specific restriction protein A